MTASETSSTLDRTPTVLYEPSIYITIESDPEFLGRRNLIQHSGSPWSLAINLLNTDGGTGVTILHTRSDYTSISGTSLIQQTDGIAIFLER